jgi:hypothetical protein
LIDATKKIMEARKLTAPIFARAWKKSGPGGRTTQRKLLERFQNVTMLIAETCTQGNAVFVPLLSREQVDSALEDLKEAEAQLQQLRRKLERSRP